MPGFDDNGDTSFPVRFDHDDKGFYHVPVDLLREILH